MALDLSTLVESEKTLPFQPDWAERDSEGLVIVCPLEIAGVTIEGLQFRATAKKRLPDEMVTFQVEYHPPGELGGPLCRLEWRPLSSHSNKGRGPVEWQNRLTGRGIGSVRDAHCRTLMSKCSTAPLPR
jgi:hypothetical protein